MTGAYIGRSLKMNKSIIKVDLSENNFSCNTLQCLSDSLKSSDCLIKSVSLASNPLYNNKNEQGFLAAVTEFSSMLEVNCSITYFSIWQCGIGSSATDVLLHGFEKNDSITCFEIGYNGFTLEQERNVVKKLKENIAISENYEQNARRLRLKQIEEDSAQCEKEKSVEQERERENWVRRQKMLRAEEMRLNLEQSRENEKKLKEQQKEEAKKLDDQKAKAERASKKKAKRKKKGSKKKK